MGLPKDAGRAAYFAVLEVSLEEELSALGASGLLSAEPGLPSEDDEGAAPFPPDVLELGAFLA